MSCDITITYPVAINWLFPQFLGKFEFRVLRLVCLIKSWYVVSWQWDLLFSNQLLINTYIT